MRAFARHWRRSTGAILPSVGNWLRIGTAVGMVESNGLVNRRTSCN